jgi:hypothetical protein
MPGLKEARSQMNPDDYPVLGQFTETILSFTGETLTFVSGNTQISELFKYTADIIVESTDNLLSYSVYINNNYVGDDIEKIQITNGDTLKFIVTKNNVSDSATIKTVAYII